MNAPAPIHFYFDFSSPYAYIASEWIAALAARHGRPVRWHAILLGVTFQAAELKSPVSYPIKREYSLRDFARSARMEGVPMVMPSPFPIASHNAARLFWWLDSQDPQRAVEWAHAGLRGYFALNQGYAVAGGVVLLLSFVLSLFYTAMHYAPKVFTLTVILFLASLADDLDRANTCYDRALGLAESRVVGRQVAVAVDRDAVDDLVRELQLALLHLREELVGQCAETPGVAHIESLSVRDVYTQSTVAVESEDAIDIVKPGCL